MHSLLLNIPSGVVNIFLMSIAMVASHYFKEIGYIALAGNTLAFIGVILLLVLPQNGARLLGIYLSENYIANAFLQAYVLNNVSGKTKKSFHLIVTSVGLTVGSIVGPLAIRQKDAPQYAPGLTLFIVALAVSAALLLYLRWSYKRENKSRQDVSEVGPEHDRPQTNVAGDITDRQNLHFTYRL